MDPTQFETHPSRYKHWKLTVSGDTARMVMAVDADHPHRPGYELKLNSYDLSVDIELADAVQRLRFEHPEVKVVVFTAELDKVFCSGANIYMLGLSTHSFKVNFCKFTNETRLYLEDASAHSGLKSLAACKGTTAGGGYELALACDEILLVDDGNSAVSFPETPLLAVLPGTRSGPATSSSSTATTSRSTSSWPTRSSGCASSTPRSARSCSPPTSTGCSARAPTSTCSGCRPTRSR